jgi:hypothetical protein
MSRIGSMATQLERFFMSGEFSCLSVVPALFDRRAPNSPTTLRLRSRCTSADSADVLAGVFTTAFYKNAATQHLDASLRIIHFLLKRLA